MRARRCAAEGHAEPNAHALANRRGPAQCALERTHEQNRARAARGRFRTWSLRARIGTAVVYQNDRRSWPRAPSQVARSRPVLATPSPCCYRRRRRGLEAAPEGW